MCVIAVFARGFFGKEAGQGELRWRLAGKFTAGLCAQSATAAATASASSLSTCLPCHRLRHVPFATLADIGLANAGEYLGATFGKHMAVIWAVRASCRCLLSLLPLPAAMLACQRCIHDCLASRRHSQGS